MTKYIFLSAAEGQRPSNYSSCRCSWIFRLIYALSTSTTVLPPIFLNILNLSIYSCLEPRGVVILPLDEVAVIPLYAKRNLLWACVNSTYPVTMVIPSSA